MSRLAILSLAVLLAGPALAADIAEARPPNQSLVQNLPPASSRIVPLAPPIRLGETVRPLIELEAFWLRVRQCQTAPEVAAQLDARYGGLPMTFQGIDTRLGEFRRVTVLRAYRRVEDEAIDLPAVSFDIVSDGTPRTVTIPLWSGVRVYP